ncbi:hypothetical protein Scep_028553 [Stephania cephalantha]|uniref:Transmembrane protein n=1 Tax=Stephania cephalantha TaxID=152367 RepID=A0AAP0EA58_9MAGN
MEEKQNPLRPETSRSSSKVLVEMLCFLSSLTMDPLFSVFVTLCTLILLYFPKQFLTLIFSPILISTSIILSTLLRLGSNQHTDKENFSNSPKKDLELVKSRTETKTEHEIETKIETCAAPNEYFSEPFMEWNVRAPLEVIHEEYDEGVEEKEDEETNNFDEEKQSTVVSLALYYPESSDSECSSDGEFSGIEGWDSPENICFMWDDDDDDDDDDEKDDLIEIELDGMKKSCFDFQVEEDNLIEIEISHGLN